MKPFAVKIWIGGCCAPHTSTSGELTVIVPKRVLPNPVNRCNTGPLTGTDATAVELGAVEVDALAFVAFAGIGPDRAVEAVCEEPVERVDTVSGDAAVGVVVCVEVLEEPLPQPASSTAAINASSPIVLNPLKCLLQDRLICKHRSSELIGSKGSWRAPDLGATTLSAALAAPRACPPPRLRSAPCRVSPSAAAPAC
jgi:hypothetical protein